MPNEVCARLMISETAGDCCTPERVRLFRHYGIALLLYVLLSALYRLVLVPYAGTINLTVPTHADGQAYRAYAEVFSQQGFAAFTRTQNYLVPTLLAYCFGDIPHADLMINLMFVALTGLIVLKFMNARGIASPWPIYIIILNPQTIYYSQDFLKEIPSLFVFALFLYALASKSYIQALLSVALATAVRTQIGLILLCFLVLHFLLSHLHASQRWRAAALLLTLCTILAAAPLIYANFFTGEMISLSYYRAQAPGFGIGALLETGMLQIPFLSIPIAPLRLVQNLLEPWPRIVLIDCVDGIRRLNLSTCISALTTLMLAPFLVRFFCLSLRYLAHFVRPLAYAATDDTVPFFIFVLLTTSLNPWIHSRYLFYCATLVCLCCYCDKSPWSKWQIPVTGAVFLMYAAAAWHYWV